jgi:hypothetical protein
VDKKIITKIFYKIEIIILVLLAVSGIVIQVFGATKVGVSTDEPYYVEATENYLNYGWYLPDDYLEEFKNRELEHPNIYVYGPIPDVLSHKVNVYLGNEEKNVLSVDAAAYQVRHIFISFLFIGFLSITYFVIHTITKSHKFALLAVVILLSIPELVGHSMFNQKDVSVAIGVTLFTYSLILINTKKYLSTIFVGVLGIILSLGSRPGIWTLIVVLLIGFLVFNLFVNRSWAKLIKELFISVVTILISIIILIWLYPNLFSNFFGLLIKSFTNSSKYWAFHDTLTNGRIEKYPISKLYIPDWLITELPVFLLVIFLLATLYFTYQIFAFRSNSKDQVINLFGFLLLIQILAIPIYIFFFSSNLYSGLRQILFIFPAVGLIITLVLYRADMNFRDSTLKFLASFGFYSYLALINYEQSRLFPFSYAYVSEVRTLDEVNNNWPTDFWRLSYRELVTKVDKDGLAVCNPFLLENGQHVDDKLRGWPFSRNNLCDNDPRFKPYLESAGQASNLILKNDLQYWYIRSNDFGYNIPSNCKLIDEVSRMLRGKKLMMSYLTLCEYPLEEFKSLSNNFSEIVDDYLINGWSNPEENWIWSVGDEAYIAFKITESTPTKQVNISIQGDYFAEEIKQRPLYFQINDEPVTYSMKKIKNKKYYNIKYQLKNDEHFQNTIVIKILTPNKVSPRKLGLGLDERELGFKFEKIFIN